jgi:hypothetical protein
VPHHIDYDDDYDNDNDNDNDSDRVRRSLWTTPVSSA